MEKVSTIPELPLSLCVLRGSNARGPRYAVLLLILQRSGDEVGE
jgi:hypothetical protein